MSIRVVYTDGVIEPVDHVNDVRPGQACIVFSDEELDNIRESFGWLKTVEPSFEFWNNPADSVYDGLAN